MTHWYSIFLLAGNCRAQYRTLTQDVPSCLERYNTIKADIAETLESGRHYPWTLLSRLEPPKVFSDIVESLIAALFIDSNGSWDVCTTFLEKLGLLTYLQRVVDGQVEHLLHPKEELGQLANTDRVQYELSREGEEGSQRLTCSVKVGYREVVSISDGSSQIEAETRAADAACKILKSERRSHRTRVDVGDRTKGAEGDKYCNDKEADDNDDVQSDEGDEYDDDNDEDSERQVSAGEEMDVDVEDEYMTADE